MALNIKRIFKIYKKNSCKFKAGDIVEVDTNGNIYVNGIIEPQHIRENDYLGGYMESRAGLTHQIVAKTFPEICCEKKDDGKYWTIDHLNGDKTDNRAVNLVYKHHKDNMLNPNTKFKAHTIEARKKQSEAQKGLLLNRKDMSRGVYQYDKKYNLIAKYPSIAEANRTLGHSYRISDVCRGKRKTAKGYYWSYNLIERKEEVA